MGIRTELTVRLANSPGVLAGVCRMLSDGQVNILGMSLEAGGHLRLVVDNPLHAAGLLREHRHEVSERDVLIIQVPNRPGAFARIGRLLSDAGVNVDYAYGAGVEGNPMAAVVVGVEDAVRASAAAGI